MLILPLTIRGQTTELRQADNGAWICPVCGHTLDQPPYDPESAAPSRAFCPTCDVQFGWDDMVPPDAPSGTLQRRWQQLREDWMRDHATEDEIRDGQINLGIAPENA